ncbi:MAG: hypothetical protein ACI9SD_001410, partial [Pseudohongiellaceae bacterium]
LQLVKLKTINIVKSILLLLFIIVFIGLVL